MKEYTIKFKVYKNGNLKVSRVNRGFTAIELLGLLHRAIFEIHRMMDGSLKVDEVHTKVIIDKKK